MDLRALSRTVANKQDAVAIAMTVILPLSHGVEMPRWRQRCYYFFGNMI
jgi:hypothetical protein